ncbi:MAG: LysM peptidoglycan-binding domain-containing protein [Bacteroidales bacterium]
MSVKRSLFLTRKQEWTGGVTAIAIDEDGNIVELPKQKKHTVVKGETLYSIARDNATSVDSLKKYNPWLSSYLSVGQVIILPPFQNTNEYIVHKPDAKKSLEEIANLYDVDYNKVAELNPHIAKSQ